MLIDGHAYIFEPMDSPAGYPTLEQKMRAVQTELSIHHQPVWRVRDRAFADNSVLADPETGALHDVTWGRDKDRLTWTYQGETYTKQYLPPPAQQPRNARRPPHRRNGLRPGRYRHPPQRLPPRPQQQVPFRGRRPSPRPHQEPRTHTRNRHPLRPRRRPPGSRALDERRGRVRLPVLHPPLLDWRLCRKLERRPHARILARHFRPSDCPSTSPYNRGPVRPSQSRALPATSRSSTPSTTGCKTTPTPPSYSPTASPGETSARTTASSSPKMSGGSSSPTSAISSFSSPSSSAASGNTHSKTSSPPSKKSSTASAPTTS